MNQELMQILFMLIEERCQQAVAQSKGDTGLAWSHEQYARRLQDELILGVSKDGSHD